MLSEGDDTFNVSLLDLSVASPHFGDCQLGAKLRDHVVVRVRIDRFLDDERVVIFPNALL